MPLDITFTLSDRDLDKFKTIVDKARTTSASSQSPAEIERAAYKIVDVAMNNDLPDFIAERLLQLKVLLEMMKDDEWQLGDKDRERITSALSYFSDPIDLIPDHIPGIGFLDDAMFAEIIIRELTAEIEAYNEFCVFAKPKRSASPNRDWTRMKTERPGSAQNVMSYTLSSENHKKSPAKTISFFIFPSRLLKSSLASPLPTG